MLSAGTGPFTPFSVTRRVLQLSFLPSTALLSLMLPGRPAARSTAAPHDTISIGVGCSLTPYNNIEGSCNSFHDGVWSLHTVLIDFCSTQVNMASRMESTSSAGRIQVSQSAAALLQASGQHELIYRGLVHVRAISIITPS